MRIILPVLWGALAAVVAIHGLSGSTLVILTDGASDTGIRRDPSNAITPAAWCAVLALIYAVFPLGRAGRPPVWIGVAHLVATALGLAAVYAPDAFTRVVGRPDRYLDYAEWVGLRDQISWAGVALVLGSAAMYLLLMLVYRFRRAASENRA